MKTKSNQIHQSTGTTRKEQQKNFQKRKKKTKVVQNQSIKDAHMNQSMTRMDSHKNKNNKYSTVIGQSEILYQKRVKERILNTCNNQ
jgi:hypothetical protein